MWVGHGELEKSIEKRKKKKEAKVVILHCSVLFSFFVSAAAEM